MRGSRNHSKKIVKNQSQVYLNWLFLSGLIIVGISKVQRWRRLKTKAADLIREQEKKSDQLSWEPFVSILLPAWCEESNITACLESIQNLRYPKIETIVCAGGTDKTYQFAFRYQSPKIKVIEQNPGEGKQRALQRCLQCSSGEIIFLTDADCILDDESFEKTLTPVVNELEDVTTGSWRPHYNQTYHPFVVYQWTQNAAFEVSGPTYVSSLIGRNAAVRRSALLEAGEFNSFAPIGTDLVISNNLLSAGFRIRFIRDSKVQTKYSQDIPTYWRQQSRWFRNPILMGMKEERTRGRKNSLRAGTAALFLLLTPPLVLLGFPLIGPLWLISFWHLTLNQVIAIKLAASRGVPMQHPPWKYTFFFLYMLTGWIGAVRGLLDSIIPSRRWNW